MSAVGNMSSSKNLLNYSRFVLLYTIGVIVWGAYVRASGSGAGCGQHWPTCQGQVIPLEPTIKTMIEFSHRLTSGLSLIFVAALFFMARKKYPVGHIVRKGAFRSLIFILGEALVGAALVLLSLVENNASILRAIVIAAHLVNTFLLLYWLTFTCELQRSEIYSQKRGVLSKITSKSVFWGLVLLGLSGASGAIVALGDTLFPSLSIAHGVAQDFSSSAHFLIRLRVFHPIIAVGTGIYLYMISLKISREIDDKILNFRCKALGALVICQIMLGFLNLFLLAPVWLQLTHLLLADVVWISTVLVYLSLKNLKMELSTTSS